MARPSLPPSRWITAFAWSGTAEGERYQPQDQTGHCTLNLDITVSMLP